MNCFRLDNVSHRYDKATVLHGVDLRLEPGEIKKKGSVPKNASVFFTIFQTFMSGPDGTPYFGDYPEDFFDFIIIDECHRGGAKDESAWQDILKYFEPAVQLGLTATPKRKGNVDTYSYFGRPVYEYSLKEGINDGFLTPFRVRQITTTMDDYVFTPGDTILEGADIIEEGKRYREQDFNKSGGIVIKEREAKRVEIFMDEANQQEKAIVFCKGQPHAALIRDLINQVKESSDLHYCERVGADDGARGEAPCAFFHAEAHTPPARAGHFVTARTIHGIKDQRHECENVKEEDTGECAHALRCIGIKAVVETREEQQHLHNAKVDCQSHDGDEEAKELFKPRARVLESVTISHCGRPDVFSDTGFAPEAVNAESNEGEQRHADGERKKLAACAAILALNALGGLHDRPFQTGYCATIRTSYCAGSHRAGACPHRRACPAIRGHRCRTGCVRSARPAAIPAAG